MIEKIKKLEKELMELKNEREKEYKRRMNIAEKAIGLIKEKIPVVNWRVTGSTSRMDFGFTSDLDIDILVQESLNKTEYRFLYDYIVKKFLIEEDLFIQFYVTSLEDLHDMRETFKNMYLWYCDYFEVPRYLKVK